MPTAKKAAASKKGLSVKSFKGLSKKRIEKKSNKNFGKRMQIGKGETVPLQFLQKPDDFVEFDQHQFQDDGRWNYVPCLGDGCPLCDSDSATVKRVSYRFLACVYNLKEKKVQVLEGPKDMAGRIFYRYERKPATFLKSTFEITRFDTQPVTYACDKGDDDPVRTTGMSLIDLDEYLEEEAKRYYGEELPAASALDDDEDDDFEDDDLEDDEDDEDEDDDLDDDEDDDEDDEEDDDEDEDDDDDDDEDDEPVASKKSASKKAPAKAAAKRKRR